MKRLLVLPALLAAACSAPSEPGTGNLSPADVEFANTLHARLEAATAADQFSGAVLVKRNGTVVFERAYGFADRAAGVANTTSTKFRVGSMNKMMTAVAALQLVQAGTMGLNVPIGTYLTDYPNADVRTQVTAHHLLTHTGGTGDIFGPLFSANRLELREPSDYLELYGERGLRFTPGQQWEYSNYGFVLLGALVERVTGARYDDRLATHVFAPAGMTATGAAPEDSAVAGRAVGYTRVLSPGQLLPAGPTLPYRGTPAGGGYSTVHDFARFAAAVREQKLLDATHTTLLLAPKVSLGWAQYAYGFMDRAIAGRRFLGHTGGAPGMSGDLAFEPGGGYVVVVLSNFDPPAATSVSNWILANLPGS